MTVWTRRGYLYGFSKKKKRFDLSRGLRDGARGGGIIGVCRRRRRGSRAPEDKPWTGDRGPALLPATRTRPNPLSESESFHPVGRGGPDLGAGVMRRRSPSIRVCTARKRDNTVSLFGRTANKNYSITMRFIAYDTSSSASHTRGVIVARAVSLCAFRRPHAE